LELIGRCCRGLEDGVMKLAKSVMRVSSNSSDNDMKGMKKSFASRELPEAVLASVVGGIAEAGGCCCCCCCKCRTASELA
jgi:hypothetical protein